MYNNKWGTEKAPNAGTEGIPDMQRISRRCTVGQEQTSSQPGGFGGGLFICSAFDVFFLYLEAYPC